MMSPNPFITPAFIRQVMKETLEAYGVPLDKPRLSDFDQQTPTVDKPARTGLWLSIIGLLRKQGRTERRLPELR